MPAKIQSWRILDDVAASDPAAPFARDDEILADVGAGRQPATMRVWTTSHCIAVTQQEAARTGFARGAEELAALGWQVLLRRSGGTAVPLTPGILNLSLIYEIDAAARPSILAAYALLIAPLLDTLGDFGIRADVGRVDGSFCDGRYNLVVNGRKIAGTAQKWSAGRSGARLILSQAMMIVDSSGLSPGIAAINRLYEILALPQRIDAVRCVGIDQLLADVPRENRVLIDTVRQRLLARCGDSSHLTQSTVAAAKTCVVGYPRI